MLPTQRGPTAAGPGRATQRGPPAPTPAPAPAAATHEACAARRDSTWRCRCCWRPVRAGGAAEAGAAPPLPSGNSQFIARAAAPEGREGTRGTERT